MKVYILTDMEGISGISRQEMVRPDEGGDHYQYGRRCLTEDINAAVAGAFTGGATEVLVNDGHGGGRHLILEDADPRALYERPVSGVNMCPSLDESFDAMFLVGMHAMAGTLNGFLDHTQSSMSWFNYYLNGQKCGEIGQCTAWAGHYGVPVVLVTGDQAACDEAGRLYNTPVKVSVKTAHGRQAATCIHPKTAREMIREGARQAMAHIGSTQPWVLPKPISVRLELYRSDMADGMADSDRVTRIDARTVEMTVDSQIEILKWS
ncbi:MAG TPA: peptidase M55 [Armatimonadetes bacterium]|jgi:D-amino peptidase|nr:peptidase M55 [Armatimonadota bacterium]